MHRNLGKKAALAAALAIVALAFSATTAFAAPVLRPGVTSAPGMSGKCTNCHAYAAAKAPAAKRAKPTSVSHPYITKRRHVANRSFKVWGYVAPRLARGTESTVTLSVQQWQGSGSWVTTEGVSATATVSAKGPFKKKTNYRANMTIPVAGRYRMAATLVWKDADGVEHTKTSKFLIFRIKP